VPAGFDYLIDWWRHLNTSRAESGILFSEILAFAQCYRIDDLRPYEIDFLKILDREYSSEIAKKLRSG